MSSSFHIQLNQALQKLKKTGSEFVELFKRGSLTVEIYKPDKVDHQKPHRQDEVYVIISGAGEFILESERTTFSVGDVLFVPAGANHRFEHFTDNFTCWVMFFGPEGGELPENNSKTQP